MIPQLDTIDNTQSLYLEFIETLRDQGFSGELCPDYANRTVLATDNSIYQVLPQGVVYPKDQDDLVMLCRLAAQPNFKAIVLSPRGGGTGTNGQSLTDGLVVDISKHMNQILEINYSERWVRVQAGVVKDQLNAALRKFGLFFAPELSTSNRATIGGMINTDASGQGSCLYGKTRDHVLELHSVLLDGSKLHSKALSADELSEEQARKDRSGHIYKLVDAINKKYAKHIDEKFPKLNRCLTGYDLAHIRDEKHQINLNNILCGSEGTLAFIHEAKLQVLPIPKHAALVIVQYRDFLSALKDAKGLMGAKPSSIETVDSKVLELAKADTNWHTVAEFFPGELSQLKGINLVEFTDDDPQQLKQRVERLVTALKKRPDTSPCLGQGVAWGEAAVQRIWAMRKRAVGLLGNAQGEARPIPFIEDTAVPPENLADFIKELRDLLDQHQLEYGMFGHVDAGVLHVRPALDMKDAKQEKLVRAISDRVVELTQKYHGLFWGEHGKGVRSEYAPKFFGELYPLLQKIKAAFDPDNQLNPGKIATPDKNTHLLKIDEVTTRGQQDRLIAATSWQQFDSAVYCNGNGACYNWNFNDPMCPSWKGTRERIHSPKGRASLMREWLRLLSAKGYEPQQALTKTKGLKQSLVDLGQKLKNQKNKKQGQYDFSHEVLSAMEGCLACKSCVGQCPIKVDVPTFRSQFLHLYYSRYMRPLKDYMVGSLEFFLPHLAKLPKLYNAGTQSKFGKAFLEKTVGFVDSPALPGTSLSRLAKKMQVPMATPKHFKKLGNAELKKTVVLVQDAFTSHFEPKVVIDIAIFLRRFGFRPVIAPYRANGKPLHVHGFLGAFAKTARKNAQMLNGLAKYEVPLVGIDPAMTLTYGSEYKQALGNTEELPKIQLLQDWLATHAALLQAKNHIFVDDGQFYLLPHCTEKSNAPTSVKAWQTIFTALNQKLDIVAVGCCGMSGTFGHEKANRELSAKIFEQSWRAQVNAKDKLDKIAATGFSCRSQVKREAFVKMPHPIQLLLAQIKN